MINAKEQGKKEESRQVIEDKPYQSLTGSDREDPEVRVFSSQNQRFILCAVLWFLVGERWAIRPELDITSSHGSSFAGKN